MERSRRPYLASNCQMALNLTLSNMSKCAQLRQLIHTRLRHTALPVVDRLGRHTHHPRQIGGGETKALASRDESLRDKPNPFRRCWCLRRRPGLSQLSLQRDHLPAASRQQPGPSGSRSPGGAEPPFVFSAARTSFRARRVISSFRTLAIFGM